MRCAPSPPSITPESQNKITIVETVLFDKFARDLHRRPRRRQQLARFDLGLPRPLGERQCFSQLRFKFLSLQHLPAAFNFATRSLIWVRAASSQPDSRSMLAGSLSAFSPHWRTLYATASTRLCGVGLALTKCRNSASNDMLSQSARM